MSIGEENCAGFVSAGNIGRMADACGLADMSITVEGCVSLITLYAEMIPAKLDTLFDELEKTISAGASSELKAHMFKPIAELCARAKARLS